MALLNGNFWFQSLGPVVFFFPPSEQLENLDNVYKKNLFGYIGRTSKTGKSCRIGMRHEVQRSAAAFHTGVDQ